jgi:hypothetical protein
LILTQVSVFKDLNAGCVSDVSPGSTATAYASFILGIDDEGVAFSEKHANWINNMHKTAFAIIADSGAKADKETRADFQKYFMPLIQEGRSFIRDQADDDSDDESILSGAES